MHPIMYGSTQPGRRGELGAAGGNASGIATRPFIDRLDAHRAFVALEVQLRSIVRRLARDRRPHALDERGLGRVAVRPDDSGDAFVVSRPHDVLI